MKKPKAMLLLIQEFVLAWKQQTTGWVVKAKELHIFARHQLAVFCKYFILLFTAAVKFNVFLPSPLEGEIGLKTKSRFSSVPMIVSVVSWIPTSQNTGKNWHVQSQDLDSAPYRGLRNSDPHLSVQVISNLI